MNEVLTLQVCATGCAVSILLYASVYTLVVFKYLLAPPGILVSAECVEQQVLMCLRLKH